jgi:hypothetical protein
MLKTIFRTFILGLGVGVLVAPRPGHETRQLLSERFNRLFNTNGDGGSASEWDRPTTDSIDTTVSPNQHYTQPALGVPTSTFSDLSASTTGTSTTSTDSDVAGASDI